jgi:hypothetical protein
MLLQLLLSSFANQIKGKKVSLKKKFKGKKDGKIEGQTERKKQPFMHHLMLCFDTTKLSLCNSDPT